MYGLRETGHTGHTHGHSFSDTLQSTNTEMFSWSKYDVLILANLRGMYSKMLTGQLSPAMWLAPKKNTQKNNKKQIWNLSSPLIKLVKTPRSPLIS